MIYSKKPLVFFYHHIRPKEFLTNLSVSTSSFEEQLKYIVAKGYQTIFASDLVEKFESQKSFKKTIVLTFDDGYQDNFLYAYPLLLKYKLKATIFIATKLISNRARTNNDHLNLLASHDEINRSGAINPEDSPYFLNWEEIKKMASSGYIEFQSHGHSHGRQFISDQPMGVTTKIKPWFLSLCTAGDEREGIPLFPTASVLSSRRFTLKKNILEDCVQKYNEWRNLSAEKALSNMINYVNFLKKQRDTIGEFESENDYKIRIRTELKTSIDLLAQYIGRQPTILSYPWGSFNESLINIAKELGFKGAFMMQPPKNNVLDEIYSLKRIPTNDSLKSFKQSMLMNSRFICLLRKIKNAIIK